eukprot:jgi/Chlat1/600/Chrsp103S00950
MVWPRTPGASCDRLACLAQQLAAAGPTRPRQYEKAARSFTASHQPASRCHRLASTNGKAMATHEEKGRDLVENNPPACCGSVRGHLASMAPSVGSTTLCFLLLFLAVATRPLANAQTWPPSEDYATIIGRVYCDACQNGRYDPGTDYPRSNAEVLLQCEFLIKQDYGDNSYLIVTNVTTFTNTEGRFNFTHLADTVESTAEQGYSDSSCSVSVIRMASRCNAPLFLSDTACNNPRYKDLKGLRKGKTYNADVCFAPVPTPKKCNTNTATGRR